MTTTKCISVSEEFSKLAKDNHISWSEASKIGMSIMLAELGVKDYDNKLNLVRKMQTFKEMAENLSERMEKIENKKE
jgi:predicted DNA-binding protein YlxM (UPF0122 family)|tara:strand:- start:506 stop:736 length:231 start_codon:yes stop_codon:yes gene_type:complete